MTQHFDTIIIGAGPAGMGCGITLAKSHSNICVIDKAVFPRSKTCAGLVTGKTYALIQTLFDKAPDENLFCYSTKTIRLYRKRVLLTEAAITNSARIVNRIEFDYALVKQYKSLGGTLMEGERIIDIDYESHCVSLSNGKALTYGNIVFADGALSLSHKLLKAEKEKMAFGVEAYVPRDQFGTDSVDLYFDYVKDGYLWVFPHGDMTCVGVADLFDNRTDCKKILSDFLLSVGVDPNKQRFVGAFLPYGDVLPQNKLPQNVMLIGDAGGFTDPISGEGLYMALKTGILAAQALSESNPKKAYKKLAAPIISTVKEGCKVQRLFFSEAIQKVFLKKVVGKEDIVTYFYDNMVDEYRYDYRHIRKLFTDYKKKKS